MASMIFVHGIGGRLKSYAATFKQIEEALQKRHPNVKLFSCLWGDSLGAKLNADGASIPTYKKTQGGEKLSPEEETVRFWKALYEDPLCEIRLLGLRSLKAQISTPGTLTPSQEIKLRVESLYSSNELQEKLEKLEIDKVFSNACEIITGKDSVLFGRLLATASRPLDGDYAAIARAIVSSSRILSKEQEIYPRLLVNDQLRDEAVDAIQKVLTGNQQSRGVVDWIKSELIGLTLGIGSNVIKRKRGALADCANPFAGDIMIYQSKGKKIREFIRSQIENEQVDPPIVLLAHSLGGIACFELLIEEDLLDRVKLLITVGSQAPFFYEIDALQTLPYGQPLPAHFPEWLNIYDLRDFLSYIGDRKGIFPGKVKDEEVDNRQPFPEAHSAYWDNSQTWDLIQAKIQSVLR